MSGYPPDRSWVYDRNYPDRGGLKQSFINGVYNEFISKAQVQPDVAKEGGIRCPCDNCRCTQIRSAQEVVYHLCKHGFQPNYCYWTKHGEVNPSDATTGNSTFNEDSGNADAYMMNDDPITQMQDMVNDAFGLSHDSESMDDEGNEEIPEQPPNKDAKDFYDLLLAANRPLYEGASETRLSICVKLMACKTNWNVPEKCLDFFASMLIAVCPSKDTLPNNYYQAKRLVSMLGLKSQQIDCCPKGCMLYYKDNENDRECKFCNAHRYIPCNIGIGRHKEVPAKKMFYFPLTPRLKRLYASPATAAEMRWHHENKSCSNTLRHPSDGAAWKHFDAVYPDFAKESRNVRLGLCSDGFTPYIQASSTPYSCWPVIVTPYNLPPEMCMKKPFMFLSCIIPGPDNPKLKIDVFLQPLIDELKELWSVGALTYDISKKQNFLMKAILMWTINDFPAYGMLSGWSTHGKLACPVCMNDTKSFWLKYGGKNSWFDCHRRFLPHNHTFRKSRKRFTSKRVEKDGPPKILTGDEIWDLVCNLPTVVVDGEVGMIPGRGVSHNWLKRSIFWDLPYWKDNLLRHNLDVMHIEKNFFDNVFNTVMDDKDKTKDNIKARMDLKIICTRSDLEIVQKTNGKATKPKATYCLSSNEAKSVCRWIKQLKMPDGYASNLARCANVDSGRMYNMKSHDCHVFMECLLPFAFASLEDFVWNPLTELSQFFKALCSNTLRREELIKLNANISVILCKLERIFPPGFFDSMEHLPIHLPNEAMLGGPVQYRWMYPFERMMGDFKRTVKNKAKVEGSICMSYLQRETTFFCSHYFKADSLINKSQRNEAITMNDVMTSTLSISNQLGRHSGKSKEYWLTDDEWRSAHVHVLINCNEVKPYIEIGEDAWKSLKEEWDKPEFKEKSMKAKQNRASARGGSVHTGGSISTVEIAMRLAKKLGREPFVDEIFIHTHQKKDDKTWVDERAKTTYEAYQEKIAEVSQGVGSNSQDVDPTIKLNIWAQSAGGKKRGRLYGTGDLACNYSPGVSCLTQESRAATGSCHFQSQYSPEMTAQMAATFEERARVAAQEAVQEALREANERAQLEQERATNFERQLKEMANSIALMQSQNRCAPRHEDYMDDESDGSD